MNKPPSILRVEIEPGGVLLTADSTDEREQEGIFNPAVAGNYLLYRAAGPGNYSRVMAAELTYDQGRGDCNARRMDRVALEPEEAYERLPDGSGGVEDPRITKVVGEDFTMLYTAYGFQPGIGQQSPAIAVAVSDNGLNWRRLGPVSFEPFTWQGKEVDFNLVPNKDAVLFSEKINGRYAMYHRPMWSKSQAQALGVPARAIWYAEADRLAGPWANHALVAGPNEPWEASGLGAGVPPIKIGESWLNIYHGFIYDGQHKHYSAGAFTTPATQPQHITWRQQTPALEPIVFDENFQVERHIAFPTAAWPTPDGQTIIVWGREDRLIMWGKLRVTQSPSLPPATVRLPA